MTEPVTRPVQPTAPPPPWDGPAVPPPAPPHRPWRGPLVALAIAVTILMVGAVTLTAVLAFFARETQTVRHFDASVREITVVSDVGDVTVRTGVPGEAARVVVNSVVAFGDPQWSVTQTGPALALRSSCDRAFAFGVDQCAVNFHVVVPPETTVSVRTSTGSVRVDGVRGDVTVRADTGDVTVRETTGAIDVRSSTGSIQTQSAGAGPVMARTDTGDVRLRFAASPASAEASTSTGEVLVLVPDDGTVYNVDAASDIGDVRVDAPSAPNSTRLISAQSDTGDVRVLTTS